MAIKRLKGKVPGMKKPRPFKASGSAKPGGEPGVSAGLAMKARVDRGKLK